MRPFRKAREAADPQTMRVLFLGSYDTRGGAAIAATRLISRLARDKTVEVLQIVSRQHSDAPWTISIDRAHRFPAWRKLRQASAARNIACADPFNWLPFETRYIRRAIEIWQPDIIHLHNLHGALGTIPTAMLARLARNVPIVWTLHDMWIATGHCAYSMDCEGWRNGCGNCPNLSAYPSLLFDRTAAIVRSRTRALTEASPTLVTPSHWLHDVVKEAPATRGLDVHVIPNGIDLDVFNSDGREATRKRLGIAPDCPVLMFAAETLDGDPRKGGRELRAAIERVQQIRANAPLDIILMGGGGAGLLTGIDGLAVHPVGFVSEEREAAAFYAAADLFVCPSLQDNLPNTLIEAAACGTAAVAFDVGGCGEVIETGITGKTVVVGDVFALSIAIADSLADDDGLARMGMAAREMAERCCAEERMTSDYVTLYHQITQRRLQSC